MSTRDAFTFIDKILIGAYSTITTVECCIVCLEFSKNKPGEGIRKFIDYNVDNDENMTIDKLYDSTFHIDSSKYESNRIGTVPRLMCGFIIGICGAYINVYTIKNYTGYKFYFAILGTFLISCGSSIYIVPFLECINKY